MNSANFFSQLESIFPYFSLGFISYKIWKMIVPNKKNMLKDNYFEIISLGILYKLVYLSIDFLNKPIKILLIISMSFVLPLLLKKILLSKLIKENTVNTISPLAWDFFFEKREPCVVVVYIKGKEKPIVGYYGTNSFASAYPNEQSIYLEFIYATDDNNQVVEFSDYSKGVLIKGSEISRINFMDANIIESNGGE
ncbi:DUF6338 family protein [Psychrilyobacter atlanticus]|uniref:DUF6338 family protein n=1 Tax=Psychrilyobacter atlanticus TaxID=271091 RepID=UPI0004079B1C|nr:DUF6338 family protein [Psychrilyobacter atlanticus]